MAGPGRPRKIVRTQTSKMSKEERIQRQVQESKLKVSRLQLVEAAKKMTFANKAAKDEYIRIIDAAAAVELLDDMDLAYIKMYADAWGLYNMALKDIKQQGPTIRVETGQGNVRPIKNPAVSAMNDYIKTMMQCSTKLGLATTDRLKLVVPEPDEAPVNRFIRFVK